MKKAKIVIATIGLFAVVGGALSFKAKRVEWNVYCSRLNAAGEVTCNKLTYYRTEVIVGGIATTKPCTFRGIRVKIYYTNTVICPPLTGTVYYTTMQ